MKKVNYKKPKSKKVNYKERKVKKERNFSFNLPSFNFGKTKSYKSPTKQVKNNFKLRTNKRVPKKYSDQVNSNHLRKNRVLVSLIVVFAIILGGIGVYAFSNYTSESIVEVEYYGKTTKKVTIGITTKSNEIVSGYKTDEDDVVLLNGKEIKESVRLKDGDFLQIVNVRIDVTTEIDDVAVKEERKEEPTIKKGSVIVAQEGVPGEIVYTVTKTYYNGKLHSEDKKIKSETAMKPIIILEGTGDSTTYNGEIYGGANTDSDVFQNEGQVPNGSPAHEPHTGTPDLGGGSKPVEPPKNTECKIIINGKETLVPC